MNIIGVTNYNLKTKDGLHIRKATKVILDNGKEVHFLEKISKKDALLQVENTMKTHPEYYN